MNEVIQDLCGGITERFGRGPMVSIGVLGVSLLIGIFIHYVVLRGLSVLLRRTKNDLDQLVLNALRWPVIASVGLGGAFVAVHQHGASEALAQGTGRVLLTIGLLLWTLLGLRLAGLLVQYASRVADRFPSIDRRTAPLFGNVATVLVGGLALYLFLLIWGIDPTGWLASAGIAGIAVGFAAKDTLSNLFAGVSIIADVPYKIGDYIVLDDGVRGAVVHIGLRSTRLQTRDDVYITIPNSVIGTSKIVNQSGGQDTAMRVRIPVGVAYDSDVEQVKRVLIEIANNSETICAEPAARVRLRRLGDSALEFELLFWIPEPSLRGETVDAVLSTMVSRFRLEKINIPFPQQVVHLPPGLRRAES